MADQPGMPPLPPVPVLARSSHDRIAVRRTEPEWLSKAWQADGTRVLVLSRNATVYAPTGTTLEFLHPSDLDVAGDRILLGEAGGSVYFAVLGYDDVSGEGWHGLRDLAVGLDDLQVGLLTSAVALQAWHERHLHCPRCGALTEVTHAGWTRRCLQDGSEHFPRTDPAVIMLVHDGADRCLLGRSPAWAEGRFSVLAGFVEAGESAEAAVAREVREEVGISVKNIRYVASQPHPFPASLMLGFTAEVDGDPTLVIDRVEIAEADWFTREQIRRAADWGSETVDAGVVLRGLPPAMSIARQLINSWLAEG